MACSRDEKCGAEGGNRTRTVLADRGILSPLRLPIPPPPHIETKEVVQYPRRPHLTGCRSCAAMSVSRHRQ